ncbi:efflux pump antibiotic resistance protein [Cladophialophora carrionii]|uniref:Efflux pump antibiotic resistance protein n=1 Tax=Cladophialophora carrionii TaxID=86049 RepID=A0A1C1D1K5_9EURO|nr:efflux pump antibiotic resistance protein [Cladophialophora carrionii]
MVLAVIVLADIFLLGERAKYVGVMNAVWAVGSVCGPVLGGALAQRWIFWINIPLVVLSITSIAAFLPRRAAEIPLWTKLGHIDYVGIVMFLTFGVLFFLPLVFAGIIRPWSSWEVLVPLLVGSAGMVLFRGYEKKVAKEPMLRLAVFANRTANVGQFGIFVHGVLLWSLSFRKLFTVAPAAVVTGLYISSTGQYRWAVWAGWFLTTLGYALLCLLKPGTTVPSWIVLDLVAGLGVGMLVPAVSITVQAATQGTNVFHSISMYALVRASGQACGVAIGTAIFQTQCKSVLAGMSGINLTAEALIREIHQSSGTPDQLDELQEAVVRSVRIVWA